MKIVAKANLYLIVVAVLIFYSCSPFSKVAGATHIQSGGSYIAVVNSQVGMKALTFGDFEFAVRRKEYKALHHSKLRYKDILVYAKTSEPTYEYYILFNPKKAEIDSNFFLVKDTLMNHNRYVMLISKSAPQKDVAFLQNSISVK